MREPANLEIRLPRDPAAPSLARRALRDHCGDRVDIEGRADAELMVSEMVTNALLHGQGQITLLVAVSRDRLLVEVGDEGLGFADEQRRRDDQLGGWGLGIVADASSRWGVRHDCRVWFELDLHGA